MVAEHISLFYHHLTSCSLAKISMVAEPAIDGVYTSLGCSLAKISMVAERQLYEVELLDGCSLAKISMVAEPVR